MPAKHRFAARFNRLFVALLFIISFLQFPPVHPVHAAAQILTVGTEEDIYPSDPSNTGCFNVSPPYPFCSLRAAIAQANQDDSGDDYQINFDIRDPDNPTQPKDYPWIIKLSLTNTGGVGIEDEEEGDLDILDGTILTIQGQPDRNDIIIDGTAGDNPGLADRVFHITFNGSLTVSNLIIQNGRTNREMTVPPGITVVEYGGGIYNLGDLHLSNVLIQDNSTRVGINISGGDGGGIYNAGTMLIENSELADNFSGAGGVGSSGLTGGSGGGIFNASGGNLTLSSTLFSGNHTGDGGANYYGGGGGALYNNGIANVSNSTFDGNYTGDGSPVAGSGGSGGAINNNASATLYLQATDFLNNYTGEGALATGSQKGKGGNGGALSNSGSIPLMTSLTFTNNHTGKGGGEGNTGGDGGDGGAIYNSSVLGDGEISVDPTPLTLTLDQNYTGDGGLGELTGGSGGNGGAIFNDSSGLIQNPLQATFIHNSTGEGGIANNDTGGHGGNGGALFNAGTINSNNLLGIEDSTFTENKAGNGGTLAGTGFSGDGGEGGAIFNRGLIRSIARTIFQTNQAGNGGVFQTINPNTNGGKGGKGGAILNEGEITRLFESSLNSNLAGNGANGYLAGSGGDGGGVANKGTIDISASTLFDNSAGNGGNGKNPAGDGGNGGGVAQYASPSLLRIYNSTISQNHSGIAGSPIYPGYMNPGFGGDGGGIWVDIGEAIITETTIYKNDAPTSPGHIGHGGGVVNNTPNGYTTLKGSILAGNTVDSGATPSDCFTTNSTLRSFGYNLVGHTAPDNNNAGNKCVAFTPAGKIAGDPPDYPDHAVVLSDLQDNGGPTLTHLPDEDLNPWLIDQLPMPQCTYLSDQRGLPRPGGRACDVGSVEAGAANWIFLPSIKKNQ